MGIDKTDAHSCKAVDIRRPGLSVSAEMADPVIQVVNGNEQHVHFVCAEGGS